MNQTQGDTLETGQGMTGSRGLDVQTLDYAQLSIMAPPEDLTMVFPRIQNMSHRKSPVTRQPTVFKMRVITVDWFN
jgi:hypothetical protein